MAEICKKFRLKVTLPNTCFIGRAEFLNSKDQMIYTDANGKLIVENKAITPFELGDFIDKHLNKETYVNPHSRKLKGVVTPRYVLKLIDRGGKAFT